MRILIHSHTLSAATRLLRALRPSQGSVLDHIINSGSDTLRDFSIIINLRMNQAEIPGDTNPQRERVEGLQHSHSHPVTRETSIGKVNTGLNSAGFRTIDYLDLNRRLPKCCGLS